MSMTMQEIRNKKFWDCGQRDQMARSIIFQYFAFTTMNIWPILIKKIAKVDSKCYQIPINPKNIAKYLWNVA